MKKKLKIALLVVTVLVLAAASYLLYIFKFKEYDVADDVVEEIVANPYEIELPDGSKLTLDENGEFVAVNQVAKKSTNSEGTAEPSSEGESASSASSAGNDTPKDENPDNSTTPDSTKNDKPVEEAQKPTVASIKQKYVATFEALQSQADGKLNSLIGRAKKEYVDKKANGESIDYGYFYNKYAGAASSLEAQTDAVFHGVIVAVEAELAANNFDKSYAQSFVDDYEAKKKARRDSILKQVTNR